MSPPTSRARRSLRLVLATLAAAAALLARPAPARADTPPVVIAAVSFTLAAPAIPAAVIGLGLLADRNVFPPRGWGAAYIIGGALGIGFGVAAIVLDAQQLGPCGEGCGTIYGVAGTGAVLGAFMVGFGIGDVATIRYRRAMKVVPVPVVIRTERGPVVGAGIAGVTF